MHDPRSLSRQYPGEQKSNDDSNLMNQIGRKICEMELSVTKQFLYIFLVLIFMYCIYVLMPYTFISTLFEDEKF